MAALHAAPFADCCQRYVIVPLPPEAGVVDVRVAGVAPLHIVWSLPTAPGINAGKTVTVTTFEVWVMDSVVVRIRRYCLVAVSVGGEYVA